MYFLFPRDPGSPNLRIFFIEPLITIRFVSLMKDTPTAHRIWRSVEPFGSLGIVSFAGLRTGHAQVVIVPGYGVAVSKAQYALAELVELLSKTFGQQ